MAMMNRVLVTSLEPLDKSRHRARKSLDFSVGTVIDSVFLLSITVYVTCTYEGSLMCSQHSLVK